MIGRGGSQSATAGRGPAKRRASGPGNGNGGSPQREGAGAKRRGRARRFAFLRRPSARLLAGLLGGLIVLGGVYLWLRDSSLVAVQNVRVVGASGPDARQIRGALRSAGRTMTTLDVNIRALQTAVAPYPVVKGIDVSTAFPHELTVTVSEQVPVAVVDAGGQRIAVAADGTLLHDVRDLQRLPVVSLGAFPGGTHLTGYSLAEVRLLGAAPYQLLGRLSTVSDGPAHGLASQLRGGPELYFGAGAELPAKWAAVTEVLANSGSAGAQYIDVSDPNRPAAGTGSDTASSAAGAATSTAAGAATSPASGATTTTPPGG